MRLTAVDGAVHVMAEDEPRLLAGPFTSAQGARIWIIEQLERNLSPTKMAVWYKVMGALTPTHDAGLELYLMDLVLKGRTFEQIARYLPVDRVDRRRLAAGDAT